jgi:hypothetical protein
MAPFAYLVRIRLAVAPQRGSRPISWDSASSGHLTTRGVGVSCLQPQPLTLAAELADEVDPRSASSLKGSAHPLPSDHAAGAGQGQSMSTQA